MKVRNYILKFRNFQKNNFVLLFSILVYLISVLIVSPWGNYAVGDDLYYLFQLQGFENGDYVKNSHIDTSIILQIFIGLIWTKIFGINFLFLKILTIFFTFILIYYLVKTFKELKVSNSLSIFGVFLIIFNPKIYLSSLSFNSEIYFILFIVLAFYYLLKYENTGSYWYLLIGSLFGGLSVLVRQVGILSIFLIILFIYLNYKKNTKTKINIFKISIPFLVFISLSLLGIFWPKYVSEYQENSLSILNVIDFNEITLKILNIWKEIPYISLLSIPFIFLFLRNIPKKFKILSFILGLVLGLILFKINVFSMGNILYVEGIDARAYSILRDHSLNNSFFKLLLAISFGIVFVSLILNIFLNFKSLINDKKYLIISFTALIYLGSTLLAETVYDRYFIHFELFFVIFIIYYLNNQKYKIFKTEIFILISFIILSTVYALDFHQDTKIKWNMAIETAMYYGIRLEEVLVQENFLKYSYILKIEDYKGLRPVKPFYPEYKCFTVNDIEVRPNIFREFLFLTTKVAKKFDFLNLEGIKGFGLTAGYVQNCSNCTTLKKEYYFSPIYEVVGISKFVKTYCLEIKN
jgi:hypothetical protein